MSAGLPSPLPPVPQGGPAQDAAGMLRAFLDLDDEPRTVVDARTLAFVDFNDATCATMGRGREALLSGRGGGMSAYNGLTLSAFQAHYADLIEQAPAAAEHDSSFIRADGTLMEVTVRRQAFRWDGRWRVLWCTRALPASPQASYVASLARFRELMRRNASAITMIDCRTLRHIDATDAACQMLGYSREALMAREPHALMGMARDDLAALLGKIALTSPYPRNLDAVIEHGAGGQVHASITCYAFQSDANWVLVSTIEDFSARRAAQHSLRQLHSAIDQAADAVVLIDAETCRYLYVNATSCRSLGLTREQHMALYPWQLTAGNADPAVFRERYQALVAQSPRVETGEGRMRRPGGGTLPVAFSRSAVQLDGRWVIVVTGRDITERRRADAELRRHTAELARVNQELERFASVASHDLSQPLRAVASYTELLERRYGPGLNDEAREFIGYAVDGARRMKRLIDDLLAYSRARRADEPLAEVDMERVLDDVLGNLAQLIADKAAVVRRQRLPTVRGEATALAQLLQNLLGNAVKFVSGRAPVVEVGAERGDAQGQAGWVFRVADNGIGIEPRYFERVFELFQRLNTQDKFEGTGIGLAVCKQIVERHGGRIWVESRPGEGTTFFFTIASERASSHGLVRIPS